MVRAVSASSNSRYLVSGSYDGTIKIFDFDKRALVHTFDSKSFTTALQGEGSPVFCLSLTHDNQYIVAGFKDKCLRVFDIEKKEIKHVFEKTHQSKISLYCFENLLGWITSITITSDDRFAIAGSFGGAVTIFDISKFEKIHSFGNIHNCKFSLL